jgi:hypothetical protein
MGDDDVRGVVRGTLRKKRIAWVLSRQFFARVIEFLSFSYRVKYPQKPSCFFFK